MTGVGLQESLANQIRNFAAGSSQGRSSIFNLSVFRGQELQNNLEMSVHQVRLPPGKEATKFRAQS